MDFYTRSSILLTTAVLVAYLNHRFIRMQTTIAIMTASLLVSILLIALQQIGVIDITNVANTWGHRSSFQDLLLKGMLSFLLFAGALTIDLNALKQQKWEVGLLSSFSTVASMFLIGISLYYFLELIGWKIDLIYCMLFGALISPTDPIAVLSTFKEIRVPKTLQACIAGESLFNDGVGIVLFSVLFALAFQHQPITFGLVTTLFLKQAIGGLGYGLLLGLFCAWLLKPITDKMIAILLTLGMVSGGYTLALWLNISGPLAMVLFGICLRQKLQKGQSDTSRDNSRETKPILHELELFWEIVDQILNAILFLLIGFEIIMIKISWLNWVVLAFAIPTLLLVRLITVAIPLKLLEKKRSLAPYTLAILTWGGLRGGLALALALSLPVSNSMNLLVSVTYGIVAFSVIVQGLTIKTLAKKV